MPQDLQGTSSEAHYSHPENGEIGHGTENNWNSPGERLLSKGNGEQVARVCKTAYTTVFCCRQFSLLHPNSTLVGDFLIYLSTSRPMFHQHNSLNERSQSRPSTRLRAIIYAGRERGNEGQAQGPAPTAPMIGRGDRLWLPCICNHPAALAAFVDNLPPSMVHYAPTKRRILPHRFGLMFTRTAQQAQQKQHTGVAVPSCR